MMLLHTNITHQTPTLTTRSPFPSPSPQLKALKTDTEKEEWVNKRYKPSVRKLPKLLE